MIHYVNKYSYIDLNKLLIGKIVRFKSDCDIFPNFDVTGKVISITPIKNELLIKILRNKKHYDIGSNMKNLSFEIL